MKIKLKWKHLNINGRLADTPNARRLFEALPIKAGVNIWGKELYFETPLSQSLEADAREIVEPGTICFWTQGSSIAIPWGPTPVSRGNECRLVTKVNIMGQLTGDLSLLNHLQAGDIIIMEKLPEV